jgi:hypothetical protein
MKETIHYELIENNKVKIEVSHEEEYHDESREKERYSK